MQEDPAGQHQHTEDAGFCQNTGEQGGCRSRGNGMGFRQPYMQGIHTGFCPETEQHQRTGEIKRRAFFFRKGCAGISEL